MRRGSGLVLGVLWLLMADLATAGDYVMVIGKGIEVCEAYLKNLNSFPDHPPMVCDRPLNPTFTEFSKPAWQPLEVWPNRHLLRQAIRLRPSNQAYSDEEFEKRDPYVKWEANLQARMAERTMTFGVANLDVDRDGQPETVLRFDSGFLCDPTNESTFANTGGIEFYVLVSDQRKIDAQKTQLAFPRYGGRPDVFVYNEMWYLTNWAGNLNFQGGQLDIHTVQPIPRRPCEFKYKGQVARRQP
jgi:hypothetical protein